MALSRREILGTSFAITAAIISGFSIPLNKIFVVAIDPLAFTAIRCIAIGVVFLFISSFKSGISPAKIKKLPWKLLIAIAATGGSFAFLLFFSGLKLTTSGRAAFLQKTMPFFVVLLAFIFLREKISRKYAAAIIAMAAGAIILYSASISPAEMWQDPALGDALVIGAAFLWAVESVIAKKAMKSGADNFIASFARMFFGGMILLGFAVLAGKADLLLSLNCQQIINISASTAVLFWYVLFWYWSIKMINVSKASAILLLAPVVSLAYGYAYLGEPAPAMQIFGSAVIIAGAYLMAGIKSEGNYVKN